MAKIGNEKIRKKSKLSRILKANEIMQTQIENTIHLNFVAISEASSCVLNLQ